MRILVLLLFLGFNALSSAAEILAWKTPISRIDRVGDISSKLIRLEKPPEASPFFKDGDELWNASFIATELDKATEKPEWVVWNATSGRLVVKGTWVALLELQYHYHLGDAPLSQCRMKVDAYRVAPDGAPPDASKPPNYSYSWMTRSGLLVKISRNEGDLSVNSEAEVIISEEQSLLQMNLLADISLPDCPRLNVGTVALLPNLLPVWLARNFDGKQGIDLMVTPTFILADGSPFHEWILKQEGDAMKPFSFKTMRESSGIIVLGEKHRLAWVRISYDELKDDIYGPERNEGSDPFTEAQSEGNNGLMSKQIKAPDVVHPYFGGMVLNLRDELRRLGLVLSDEDFTAYDPKTESIFMYSSNLGELDKFEQLFMWGGCSHGENVIITTRGDGEMRVITRTGTKSLVSSHDSQTKKSRTFEVEPTINESGDLIDLRYLYGEKTGEKVTHSFDGFVTAEAGKFLKISEIGKADGSQKITEIKAESDLVDH